MTGWKGGASGWELEEEAVLVPVPVVVVVLTEEEEEEVVAVELGGVSDMVAAEDYS